MKVFAEPLFHDFGINRISTAIKKYAPAGIEFIDTESNADLVIMYIHAHRRQMWWRAERILNRKHKYAVLQLQCRSTTNPNTTDWLKIWGNAEVVWAYYDLARLCKEDGNKVGFNFFYAPLGVDADVFHETKKDRKYIAGIHSKGWSRESLREVVLAARATGKTVLNIGKKKDLGEDIVYSGIVDDETLSLYYSQCEYVTGLRRTEGFEMPVIEGLMCGARPVCFDEPHYRQWFDGFAEFIPDISRENTILLLTELFKKEPKPVSDIEKNLVKEKFSWKKVCRGFWGNIV